MMNLQSYLPTVPQPPHDPTWWLLNTQTGWHEAELLNVEPFACPEGLALAPLPESLPSLTEPGGSFGGLTTPANVALGPDGSIYLLDIETAQLKRFDSCDCVFKPVPCFGGAGNGPRQLSSPRGIGICNGNLFVCDTGNHRLAVISLHGFALRGFWGPPPAQITNDWEPYGLAFDGRGRVFVTDGANGCIHRFSPNGRWEKCLAGFGSVKDIAIDCFDRLYVGIEGVERSVRIIDGEGKDLSIGSRADLLKSNFPCLP